MENDLQLVKLHILTTDGLGRGGDKTYSIAAGYISGLWEIKLMLNGVTGFGARPTNGRESDVINMRTYLHTGRSGEEGTRLKSNKWLLC